MKMKKTGCAVAIVMVLITGVVFCRPPLLMAATNGTAQAGFLATLQKPDSSYEQKAAACRELARIGDRGAVPVLAGLLGDEKLSHMARYGLEQIPDPSVDAAFRAGLGKLKGRLLVGLINSIGVRRDKDAIGLLGGLLKDSDPQVARAAAAALGRIGTVESGKVLESAIAAAKGDEFKFLCEECLACADVMFSEGKEARALGFYERLAKDDVPVLVRSAATRGVILSSGNVKLLIEQLNSSDPVVFAMGLRVAQELKGKKATSAIIFQIGRLPAEKVVLLVNILGKRGDKTAVPELKQLATKGDKAVRLAAIGAIAETGDSTASPALMELMSDKDAEIAKAASASLAVLPDPTINDDIVKMLDCPESSVRVRMFDLAGQRRIKKAIPVLAKAMEDKEEAVRFAAIRNFGAMAGPAELPPLLERIVKSTNAGEIGALEKAITSICLNGKDQEASVKRLVDGLSRATVESKQALLRVLRAAGGAEALKAVRGAVADSNQDVHMAAIRVLSEWKTVDAVPVLLDLAKNSKEQADKILSLRGYIGMTAKREVLPKAKLEICREAFLLIQRDEEKKLLLGALGSMGNAESLEMITSYLDQPGVKSDAVSAVLGIANRRTKKQATAATKTALEKVVKVAGNPAEVKRAEELLKQIEKEK